MQHMQQHAVEAIEPFPASKALVVLHYSCSGVAVTAAFISSNSAASP
jgi:hypothetical protein